MHTVDTTDINHSTRYAAADSILVPGGLGGTDDRNETKHLLQSFEKPNQLTVTYIPLTGYPVELQRLQRSDFYNIDKSPLTRPTEEHPCYLYEGNKLYVKPITISLDSTLEASMIRKPLDGKANKPKSEYSAFEVEFNALVRKHYPHWDAKVIRQITQDIAGLFLSPHFILLTKDS